MKICVFGLWHLGSVTAACLAQAGFMTTGLDFDRATVAKLRDGVPPLFEPGLEELIKTGLAAGTLSFGDDPGAVEDADLVWVTFDTPVDDEDRADTAFVTGCVERVFPYLPDGAVVLISSQLPVGSTRALAERFAAVARGRCVSFAYSPENLRLGQALEVFKNPGRIVIGTEDDHSRKVVGEVCGRFAKHLIWTSIESAEMVKHALNAFLATCVTFINEIASVCERVGADAGEVEVALRSEPRIGPKAYIRPGAAFAGGTLARDVRFLIELGAKLRLSLPLLSGILPSNDEHRNWSARRLAERLGSVKDKRVGVLGLSYKPGTNALRRSVAIELCRWLVREGAQVRACDPAVRALPPELAEAIELVPSAMLAAQGADALVVATEWPEFKSLSVDDVVRDMRSPIVLDQNRFLGGSFMTDARIRYVTLGKR
jgi:UDPglucose 6-dehydrogenase